MTVHDRRGVATWHETMRKAHALDLIAAEIARYLPPDSTISRDELLGKVIGIVETKTNYVFIWNLQFGPYEKPLGKFQVIASEREDKPDEKDLPHGNQPPNPKGADEKTKDNDLTTGHSQPGDGGDDNAKKKDGNA